MKRHLLFSVVLLPLLAWGTGCGGQPTVVAPLDEPVAAQDQSAEAGTSTPTSTPELEEATMTPTPAPEPTEVEVPPEADRLVQLAREDLAERLGLGLEAIRLVSVEAVEWSDASLGCPQPGMVYAQVITPGFLVVLEAEGEEYEYHTDTGDHVVHCQAEEGGQEPTAPISPLAAPGAETSVGVQVPAEAEEVVRLAIEDLGKRLGVAPGSIRLVSVQAMNWSDASLGCPQPDMMYAQVITSGFLVILEADGKGYEYHTNQKQYVVLCEK